MKDWDYYTETDVRFYGFKEESTLFSERLQAIDAAKLTAEERETAKRELKPTIRREFRELNAPHRAALRRKQDEFWADAREDLGYTETLSKEAVAAMESEAWEQEHSDGFSEVYIALQDLWAVVEAAAAAAVKVATVPAETATKKPEKNTRQIRQLQDLTTAVMISLNHSSSPRVVGIARDTASNTPNVLLATAQDVPIRITVDLQVGL